MMNEPPELRPCLIITLFVLTVIFSAPSAVAAPTELDGVIERLQQRYENITSLCADFIQESLMIGRSRSELSSGTVCFKKPGMMRWTYTKPYEDELVSNGTLTWFYQPDLAQVILTNAGRSTPAVTMDFLTGAGDLKADFFVTLIEVTAESYLLALEPKVPMAQVTGISIEVDKEDLIIKMTEVGDPFGGFTRVSLDNIRINPELVDSHFEFVVPEGTAVISP